MKYIITALMVCVAVTAEAFSTVSVEPVLPFQPVVLENVDHDLNKVFLGDLEQYPDMLEFSVFSTTSLALQLWQRATTTDVQFGVIVVRVNENGGGVTEVARAHQQTVVWNDERIVTLGKTLRTSEPLTLDLPAGQYRVEISTPQNRGAYAIRFNDVSSGYLTSVVHSYHTLRHFSYHPPTILMSPLLYYPLGIIVVVIGLLVTWRYHRRLQHGA